MQTSKSRSVSSEGSQRKSPATPKSNRANKSAGTDSDSSTSKLTPTKTPKDQSPKVIVRRSPRSPLAEKRRPGRLSELEGQLPPLQEELKNTKDQLSSSAASKKQTQQEAQDMKQQLQAMAEKLEDSKNQLVEFSALEDARLQELCKISQDRDRAWHSDLEAIQKQHSVDSAALSSAMNEIHKLKLQLMREEELSIVEDLRNDLYNSKKAEANAETKLVETQQRLDVTNATVETLRSEGLKLAELFESSISELEESRTRVASLEETVKKLEDDQPRSLESEVERLGSALQAAEEERARITMQLRSALEMVEKVRTESEKRESEVESALRNAKSELAELESNLSKSVADVAELKANLMDKENELQGISEENERLKLETEKREVKNRESYEMAMTEMELAKAKEKEALMKLGYVTEEAEHNGRRAARVYEQLEAAKVVNSEMEVELRRLRVQSDQWRKAAEAAATVLTTTGNNSRLVERSCSLDGQYKSVAGKPKNSPFSEDLDEDSPKKKNGNVLWKFGGLWKKGSK